MTLTIVLSKAAQTEFDEAADWYEQQQANLGVDFVKQMQATLDRICRVPRQFPVVLEDARQAIVDRFPYSIIFLFEAKRVVVLAIFHHRRDPAHWRRRLK